MSTRPLFRLLHDYADMGESANISREGVKTLSREIKNLESGVQIAVAELLQAKKAHMGDTIDKALAVLEPLVVVTT